MDQHRITSELHAIERDASLCEEINLGARAEALDLIALIQETARLQDHAPSCAAEQGLELLNRPVAVMV